MKIDMRHRPSPLSAGEAIEYDHAARAVAQLLFPGDPAKIQDTIEKVGGTWHLARMRGAGMSHSQY